MDSVDDLSQETNKYFNYQRSLAKQQQAKQQYLQKRVCLYMLTTVAAFILFFCRPVFPKLLKFMWIC